MIFLCKKHVKYGLKHLSIPHVQKAAISRKCKFCSNRADFQMGLFLQIQRDCNKELTLKN